MKNFQFIALALIAVMTVSCRANIQDELLTLPSADISVIVSEAGAVKSAGSGEESTLRNVQLFVFDESGSFETKKSQTINASSGEIKIGCTTGRKTVFAVANAPDLNPSSVAALNETVTALKDNTLDSFVMSGSVTPTISGTATISIELKRMVSKIVLKKVVNAMTGANAGKTFIIRAVFVDNVPANTTFGLGEPTAWYNKMKFESGDCDAFLYEGNIDRTVASSSSDETQRVFYVYPNSSTNETKSGTWSPRVSRLVIEAILDGETMYYPITVPGIGRNQAISYDGITITRPGSTNPDIPVETGDVTFSLTVSDWSSISRTEEI